MNILITSAGRRTYMVGYFRKALRDLHYEGLVFASNSVESPALREADRAFITPLIYDDAYIPFLLGKCRENSIDMIVPLFDVDLLMLSEHRMDFESVGTRVIVSGPEAVRICRDKYELFLALWRKGLRCPETVLSIDDAMLKMDAMSMAFPVIVKPRFGMGSIGLIRAYDKGELKAAVSMCRRAVESTYLRYESESAKKQCVLIQAGLSGCEYGLDVISDFDGNYLTTIVRRKLAMRSGETDEAVVLGKGDPEYKVLRELGLRIALMLSPIGLIDVDVMMDPVRLVPYVIDINARFGGGYPFSHAAGADVPGAYILLADGKKDEAKKRLVTEGGIHGYKDIVIRKR